MQLDRTRIAIRERSPSEVVDLALRLAREHAWPLAAMVLLGAAPFAIVNGLLLGSPGDDGDEQRLYQLVSLVLAFHVSPLTALPVTLFLGQALFVPRPSKRRILAEAWSSLGQLLICQVLLRGTLIAWVLAYYYGTGASTDRQLYLGLLMLTLLAFGPARLLRPFLGEVILLERNPLLGGPGMTTWRRNRELHKNVQGELFLAGVVYGWASAWFIVAAWLALGYVRAMLTNRWDVPPALFAVTWQTATFLVLGFVHVARFLRYLDLRIRREGWEVELEMRATAARMAASAHRP